MCTVLDNFCNAQGTSCVRHTVCDLPFHHPSFHHPNMLCSTTYKCLTMQLSPSYCSLSLLTASQTFLTCIVLFIHWQVLSISHHPVFPLQYPQCTLISLLLVPDESALQFYNQNKKEILNIIMPIAQETAEELITQIGNRILSSVPLSELLPAWATT